MIISIVLSYPGSKTDEVVSSLFVENLAMTVRRYSVASHIHTAPWSSEGAGAGARHGGVAVRGATVPSWGRLQQEVHINNSNISRSPSPDEGVAPAKGMITNRCSIQEYVNKNRCVDHI